MKLDYKKIIITLVLVAVFGLVVYFVWQGIAGPASPGVPAVSSSTPSAPNLPGGSLPASSTSSPQTLGGGTITFGTSSPAIIRVSNNPAEAYWIDGQTQGIFYLNQDGQVFLVNKNKDGKDTQITQQKMGALNTIAIGPGSQRVLASFGDPRAPQWGVFDDVDQVWRPLPSTVLSAAWGGDNNTFYGVVQNGSVPALASIDMSRGNAVTKILIKDFRFQDVQLSFLPPSTLLLTERASAHYPSRVWKIDTASLAVHLLMGGQNGLVLTLSDDKRIMFSFIGNAFQILDPYTLSSVAPVPFLTLPPKCTFSGVIAYCFVPDSQNFKNATLPDDYLTLKLFTSDTLYEVNAANGGMAFSNIPKLLNNGVFDAINPIFSNGFLYFRNRLDNYVYALNLTSDQFSQNGQRVGD